MYNKNDKTVFHSKQWYLQIIGILNYNHDLKNSGFKCSFGEKPRPVKCEFLFIEISEFMIMIHHIKLNKLKN